MKRFLFGILALFLVTCIGADELDNPIAGARIETSFTQVVRLIGDTATVSATYFDQYGLERDMQLSSLCANEALVSVDFFGLIAGISPSQTTVRPFLGATNGPAILVTVVATAGEVGQVKISGPAGNQVEVGASIQLSATVQTISEIPIEGLDVNWFSANEALLQISAEGLATGLSNGVCAVYVVVEGVQSNMLPILVGSTERSGSFSSANWYDTSGSARLYFSIDGDLMLELSADFETELTPGTFVYLSNSISGTTTAANGLEIAGNSPGGFKLFNISTINPSVGIDTYSRVIILCKPASITFGHATMQ